MKSIDVRKVYPRLYAILPKSVDVDLTLSKEDSPVQTPFCGDLVIMYGHDLGSTYEIVSERQRVALNLTAQELHLQAVQNLTHTDKEIRFHRADNFSFIICDGNLEASLVLHEGIWDYVADQIGGDVVVSVPARDLLLIAGTKPTEVSALAKKTRECIEMVDKPLSGRLYLRILGGWKEYEV